MKRALVASLLILASVPLFAAVSALPPVGSTESPAYTHVVPRYLEDGPEETGSENVVTAVILNYRGYDTDGEVTVIFSALVAVSAILALGRDDRGAYPVPERLPPSLVVSYIVRVLAPFIVVFSVYLIVYGHVSPGGGFQGGTILGAVVIAVTLVLGREKGEKLVPDVVRPWLQSAAPLTFTIVGILGIPIAGYFLAYPTEEALAWLRGAWLTALEAGIGIGGGAIIASIFWAMEGDS
jgi:multicomponent Na+:H+ antiporter subunit B